MDKIIGKKIMISGMVLQVLADAGYKWETMNITTRETVFIEKAVLLNALRLALAEVVSDINNGI